MLPMSDREYNLIVVLGPTASGKTRLAVELARTFGGEIISADSRQVYRGLDIGAGKDLSLYGAGPNAVRYHLIDVAGLEEEYSVFRFQRDCFGTLADLFSRGVVPIVAGGTGLYLDAVLSRYRMVDVPENAELRREMAALSDEALRARLSRLKPDMHNSTDITERSRLVRAVEIAEYSRIHEPEPAPRFKAILLGARWPREDLRQLIGERLKHRLEHGLIDEVSGLIRQGVPREKLQFLGLEYRYVEDYLSGRIASKQALHQQLHVAIGQFAKRQETWFRRMERQGHVIHWIARGDAKTAVGILAAHGFRPRETSFQ
ncbi:MAG: tRNA dimethylallyltransferase 2 [Candidatus Hydrogenedentota bacterium]